MALHITGARSLSRKEQESFTSNMDKAIKQIPELAFLLKKVEETYGRPVKTSTEADRRIHIGFYTQTSLGICLSEASAPRCYTGRTVQVHKFRRFRHFQAQAQGRSCIRVVVFHDAFRRLRGIAGRDRCYHWLGSKPPGGVEIPWRLKV